MRLRFCTPWYFHLAYLKRVCDGVWHPVYEGADGCHYVIDGEKVYAFCSFPPGEPRPTAIGAL
jgi:hypothetical protein